MEVVQQISAKLNLPQENIKNVLKLLQSDATVPFIARYRKEMTGNLDEVIIYEIKRQLYHWAELEKRKQTIIKSIDEQGKLNDLLLKKIKQITDLTILEDLYLPYKRKRLTKAGKARSNGLEPLAKIIMSQRHKSLKNIADNYLSDQIPTVDKALEGARYIIAEWINENMSVRNFMRRLYQQSAVLHSKLIKTVEQNKQSQKYLDYFDWHETLLRMPSHRLLAILRAEKEGILRLKLQVDEDFIISKLSRQFIKNDYESSSQIQQAIKDAVKRLLHPSIGTETINFYKEKAEHKAIKVFSENLKQLLLAAPLGEKKVLAIDPGYRSGCKVVCLDQQGQLLKHTTIFPHSPQQKLSEAVYQIKHLVHNYQVEAIAIGNGTASRETERFVRKIDFGTKKIPVFMVNEAGASIYSASEIAREEFPDKDITVRGAVSIGRRLQDPLAELVKIDPKSIGVGQYQHDVSQTLLKEELDKVVEYAVNLVGVNLNTASPYLLQYVSGIGPKLAQNIIRYRSVKGHFKSRLDLLKVKGLGQKAFEQSAGFLRIKNGTNPLDNSAVHPESYAIVKRMAKSLDMEITKIIGRKDLLKKIELKNFITNTTGLPTLKDILRELEKPGLDIRQKPEEFSFSPALNSIDDIVLNQIYPGIINNITDFGCFVNIGIKESGLVHISNLSKNFVRHPSEVVKLNQSVLVKVISKDAARKRIGLSLIFE